MLLRCAVPEDGVEAEPVWRPIAGSLDGSGPSGLADMGVSRLAMAVLPCFVVVDIVF